MLRDISERDVSQDDVGDRVEKKSKEGSPPCGHIARKRKGEI